MIVISAVKEDYQLPRVSFALYCRSDRPLVVSNSKEGSGVACHAYKCIKMP